MLAEFSVRSKFRHVNGCGMGGNFSNSIIKKKQFKCTIIVIDCIIIVVSIMFIKMLFSFFIFLIKKS